MDVCFLQETKLTQVIHTWHGTGYDVWAIEVDSRHRGGEGGGLASGKEMVDG